MLTRFLSTAPRWLAAALALGLAACGGGSGGMSSGMGATAQGCSSSSCGSAMVTLTDAAGDFASYAVDVTSLQLTRADGTVVETLPTKTRVDFTQLVNVTELLTTAAVPNGDYKSATMTLDYSNAAIYVYTDANNTQSVQVAQVVDSNNNVLFSLTPPAPAASTITLTVELDNAHHLVISPGQLARLALDFNVAASNTVSLANPAAPVVTVAPFIVASVVPTDTKDVRVRGALVSVDTTAMTYTVNVEPFDDDHENHGQLTVTTTAQTTFEVDGKTLNQTDGLNALNADGAGTLTVAFGTVSKTDHSFTAKHVLAGSSVQMSNLDRLQGVVVARPACATGAPADQVCLVVSRGTTWMHEDDEDHFSAKNVAVTFGAGTTITAMLAEPPAAPSAAWPSVGSRITAFGTSGSDTSGNPTFDATAGRLRIDVTSLSGTPVTGGIAAGQVTLNLMTIEGLPVSSFTFTGTGSDPTHYVVTTGALPLSGLGAANPLRFFGLVQPFGFAPPDFDAQTLVNFANTAAILDDDFGADGSATGLTAGATSLTLVQSALVAGEEHVIHVGMQTTDLAALTGNVTISPDASSNGPFAIRTEAAMSGDMMGTIDTFESFADFDTLLMSKLAGGATTVRVLAVGQFDQTTNTFTASQIAVDLH